MDKNERSDFLTLRWVLYTPGFTVRPLSPWNFVWMWLCYGPAWTRGLEGLLVSVCLKNSLRKSLKEFRYPWIWRSWDRPDVLVLIPTPAAQSSVRSHKEKPYKPNGSKIFCFHCAVWTGFLCFPLNVILWQGK